MNIQELEKLVEKWPKYADTGNPIHIFDGAWICKNWWPSINAKPKKLTVTGFNWITRNCCLVTFNNFETYEPNLIFTSREAIDAVIKLASGKIQESIKEYEEERDKEEKS